MGKIFSFDAETNGLWGQAFAIGALVYDEQGAEIARFIGRCPIKGKVDRFVAENILPQITEISVNSKSYNVLLASFADFYKANKRNADVVVHMGYIVEAKVLRDMHDKGFIKDSEGPYPLYDVSGSLQLGGANPTSVDQFAIEHGLKVDKFVGGTHNPLYDSAVTAAVYRYLNSQREYRVFREYSISSMQGKQESGITFLSPEAKGGQCGIGSSAAPELGPHISYGRTVTPVEAARRWSVADSVAQDELLKMGLIKRNDPPRSYSCRFESLVREK